MHRPRIRYVLAVATLAWINGCVTWKSISVSTTAPPAVSSEHPVRVTRLDQSVIVLEHPRVVGDSLMGDVGSPPTRLAVALRDVTRIEEQHVSALRTGGLVLGLTIAALGVATLIAVLAFAHALQ